MLSKSFGYLSNNNPHIDKVVTFGELNVLCAIAAKLTYFTQISPRLSNCLIIIFDKEFMSYSVVNINGCMHQLSLF